MPLMHGANMKMGERYNNKLRNVLLRLFQNCRVREKTRSQRVRCHGM